MMELREMPRACIIKVSAPDAPWWSKWSSNVLHEDPRKTWNARHYAPATLSLSFDRGRRITRVSLLPDMKPAEGIVKHRLSFSFPTRHANNNKKEDDTEICYYYDGHAADNEWIHLDFTPVLATAMHVTTLASPSWVAWRRICVYELMTAG